MFSLPAETDVHGDFAKIRFSQVPQMGLPSFSGNRAQYWATFRGGTWVNSAYRSLSQECVSAGEHQALD